MEVKEDISKFSRSDDLGFLIEYHSVDMLQNKKIQLLEQRMIATTSNSSPFKETNGNETHDMVEEDPKLTANENSDEKESKDVRSYNSLFYPSIGNSAKTKRISFTSYIIFPHLPQVSPSNLSLDGARKEKKKRKNYTQDEDAKIQEGVKKYGYDWDEIAKWARMERTGTQIKDRFRRLKKQTEEQNGAKKRKIDDDKGPSSPQQTTLIQQELNAVLVQVDAVKKLLDEEREKTRKKELVLAEKDEIVKKLEQQLQQSQQQQSKGDADKNDKTKKAIITILQKQCQLEKEKARAKMIQDSARLGQVVIERHGATYSEVWQDGQIFNELNQKLKQNADTREQLEKQKKEISKKVKKKSAADNISIDKEIEELLMQEELFKVRIQNLKKEEAELNVQRERLLIEKNLHVRELKRAHDEDNSRFNNNPVLKSRYFLMNLLGKGGFSEVYKGFDLVELREVACKIHQLNTEWSDKKKENYIKHAIREYNIHKSVVHSKIVSLYDVFEIDDNSFCTVLEYCNGPDLDLYLKLNGCLPEREARLIVTQIFSALSYLNDQKRPIIHYDLKPGNILFNNGEVKITDFGLSKIMDENQDMMELTSQGAGTYWYLPPECFDTGGKEPPKISSKVDVWSVGVIFFQMLFGKKPFGNNVSQQRILADNIIVNSSLEFPQKPIVSNEAKDFIRKCLQRLQDERPDAKACLSDPYLKLIVKKKEVISTKST